MLREGFEAQRTKKKKDKNVKDTSLKNIVMDRKDIKEKRMKIKVNFKPYIPKNKRTREKQETEWNNKKSFITENEAKTFIKVKDISLLTNPQKPCEMFDKDTIYLEYGGPRVLLTEDLAVNSISNEPLDLSMKCPVQREEVIPLDLSKIKDQSLLIKTKSLSNTHEHTKSKNHHVDERFIPVKQVAVFSSSSTIVQPPQINLPHTVVRPTIAKVPSNSFVICENVCQGKISRRKKPTNNISSANINQHLTESNDWHGNNQPTSSTNDIQDPLVRCQLQKQMFKNLQTKLTKTLTQKDSSKTKLDSRKNNSSVFNTKQNYVIQRKNQITNKKGMVKINEKITSNGDVFCTFINFAGKTGTKRKIKTK